MMESQIRNVIGLELSQVAPDQIVEGTRSISDTPVGHHAIRIERERVAKTFHALFLIEAKAPI
jgi:hypothetical protein